MFYSLFDSALILLKHKPYCYNSHYPKLWCTSRPQGFCSNFWIRPIPGRIYETYKSHTHILYSYEFLIYCVIVIAQINNIPWSFDWLPWCCDITASVYCQCISKWKNSLCCSVDIIFDSYHSIIILY